MNENQLLEARRLLHHHTDLFRTERSCLADLLLSIGDFEHGGFHRVLGHASIFDYLHRALRMSKGMAHYRMVASRLLRKFPEVEEPIRDGRLCLTTVVELARVMTAENRAEVLPRFLGVSRQEARQVAVEIEPSALVARRTVVSAVAAPLPAASQAAPAGRGSTIELDPPHPDRVPVPPPSRATVEPMTASESRLHITVSREFLTLLKQARAGESHRSPGATDEQVLKLALEALIEKQGKRRACVPAKVKREVVKRDGGKCQWKLADGGICGSTLELEIDHVVPRGKGGSDTIDNCRILCRPHNLEAARRAYGDEVMDRFTRSVQGSGSPVAREEAAAYGPACGPAGRRNPIVRPPAGGVGCGPCSGRKPPRSARSGFASPSSSSSAPGSSSSTTRERRSWCRSAGARRTTSDRCTWG